MGMIESLENKALQWGFNHYVVNSVRHFKSTLSGIIAILGGVTALLAALSATLHYLLDAAEGKAPVDLDHLNGLATMYAVAVTGISGGIGLISSKDHGTPDVAYNPDGTIIPRAQIVP
jgi:hypothetical protein